MTLAAAFLYGLGAATTGWLVLWFIRDARGVWEQRVSWSEAGATALVASLWPVALALVVCLLVVVGFGLVCERIFVRRY